MTGQAERVREAHRGWRQAEPAARSRIAALETFGLRYERIDDFNVLVEGFYLLNLALSYWRAQDNSCHGYLVSALDAEVRSRRASAVAAAVPHGTTVIVIDTFSSHQEKPAAGRDNVPAELEATELHQHVESAAGHQSSSALPAVWP